MKVIAYPRGGGKTTALVDWASKDITRLLLVATEGDKRDIVRRTGVNPTQLMPFRDWAAMRGQGIRPSSVAIDNADVFLRTALLGVRLDVISLSPRSLAL